MDLGVLFQMKDGSGRLKLKNTKELIFLLFYSHTCLKLTKKGAGMWFKRLESAFLSSARLKVLIPLLLEPLLKKFRQMPSVWIDPHTSLPLLHKNYSGWANTSNL